MTAFVLIPGAGGVAWYWHRVVPLLEAAGHEAIPVDLPGDDERAGLPAYADLVVRAIGARDDVTLVAQSMGGFTAALVAARVKLRRLVFVNAMIPSPGETPSAWFTNTHHVFPDDFTEEKYFLHDLPRDVVAESAKHRRRQSEKAFGDQATFDAWPDIPIHVIVAKDDRFFPRDYQLDIAYARLGLDAAVIPGGHLVALSQPRALADRLLAYVTESSESRRRSARTRA